MTEFGETTGWVVEHGPIFAPAYLRFAPSGPCWTLDPYKAVRFARRDDAEAAVAAFEPERGRATEHGWARPGQ